VTRREALLALSVAYALIAGGLAWWFGPPGLIAAGVVLIVCILLFFERVDDGETVAEPVPQQPARYSF